MKKFDLSSWPVLIVSGQVFVFARNRAGGVIAVKLNVSRYHKTRANTKSWPSPYGAAVISDKQSV